METEVLKLRTRHPFIIARGGQSDYRTVWVRLRDADGNEGWGEAAPTKFYGEFEY
jgi:L-alanine-DL-glutamate epimerase-like enolase superfamily enzyme